MSATRYQYDKVDDSLPIGEQSALTIKSGAELTPAGARIGMLLDDGREVVEVGMESMRGPRYIIVQDAA